MRHAQPVGAIGPAPRFGDDGAAAPDHQVVQVEPRRFDVVYEGQDLGGIDTGGRRRAAGEPIVFDGRGGGYRSGHGKSLFNGSVIVDPNHGVRLGSRYRAVNVFVLLLRKIQNCSRAQPERPMEPESMNRWMQRAGGDEEQAGVANDPSLDGSRWEDRIVGKEWVSTVR